MATTNTFQISLEGIRNLTKEEMEKVREAMCEAAISKLRDLLGPEAAKNVAKWSKWEWN